MFGLQQTTFFCLFLLSKNTFFCYKLNEILYEILVFSHLSDGLSCYSCVHCGDPFNASNAQITNVSDSDGYSCIVSEFFSYRYSNVLCDK